MVDNRTFVQLCPHDVPPFYELCRLYEQAAGALDLGTTTVFLGAPNSETPLSGAHYLSLPDVGDVSQARERINQLLPCRPDLCVAHRYRSLRVLDGSVIHPQVSVVLAHEFGFLSRWQRRVRLRFNKVTPLRFAGVSPAVVADLQRYLSAPRAAQVLCWPNAIDWAALERRALSRQQARAHLGLDDHEFVIGVVGRLHAKKRPQLAIDGFRLLRDRLDRPSRLIFVGDGELRSRLVGSSADLAVSFAGFIPDAARYGRAFDLWCIPSGAKEAFGMVALEAMTLGVPVVAAQVPGPESVLDELGVYFATDDPSAVARALFQGYQMVNDGHAGAYAASAKARVQREFSSAAVAARLDLLLQKSGATHQ